MNNLYSKFSINSDAAEEEIDRVYKNIVKKYTAASYKGTKETAEKKLASAKEIYEILSDPIKRAAHDKALNITPGSPYVHSTAKSDIKTGTKSTSKPASKPAAKQVTKTSSKAGTKPGTKTVTKTGTKPAAKSTAKTGAKTNSKTGTKTAAKTGAKSGVKVRQSLGAEVITEDGLSVRTVTYIPLSDKEFELLLKDILELEGQIDELRRRGKTEKDLQKEIAALDKKIKKLKVKREKEQAERLKEQIALYDKHLDSYKSSPFANSADANTVEILAADILHADSETAATEVVPEEANPEDFAVPFAAGALGAEPEPVPEVITLTDAPAESGGEKKKPKSKKKKAAGPETVPANIADALPDSGFDGGNAVIYVPPASAIEVNSAAEVDVTENAAKYSVAEVSTAAKPTEHIAVPEENGATDISQTEEALDGKHTRSDTAAAVIAPEIKSGALIGQRKGFSRGAFLTIGILLFMMFGVAAYIAAGSLFNATFIKTFTIEYTASEGGYIEGSPNQSVKKGEDGAMVRAVADEGFIFTGWSDGQTNPERTDYKIGQDFSVRAEFVKGIKVTYLTDGNGHISGSATQYVLPGGDAEKVCAEGFNGFAFDKWSDGIETEERHDKSISSEIEVTASFVRGIMLIYNAETGGQIEGKPVQAVKTGSNGQTVTAVAEDGYLFIGWSDGHQAAERVDLADTNKIFTAYFIRVYSFTYSASGGGSISGSGSQTVVKNSQGSLVTAIPDDGYKFIEWSDGITSAEREDFGSADIEAQAVFRRYYTVTYSANIPDAVFDSSLIYEVFDGEDTTEAVGVSYGGTDFVFDYWEINGSTDTAQTSSIRQELNVTGDLNVVAVFAAQYAVNYSVQLIDTDTPGSISGTSLQYIKEGADAVSVTAVAEDENYIFDYWLINDNKDTVQTLAARQETSITENLNVIAVFARQYLVTYNAGSNGKIRDTGNNLHTQAAYRVKHGGTSPTVTAVGNKGETSYKFKEWSDNSALLALRTDSPINSNITVTATFEYMPFYDGSGTTGSPYEINNSARFMLFAAGQSADGSEDYSAKHFILTEDINLSGITFIPMFAGGFGGTLDGGGHSITGMKIDFENTGNAGLFAKLSSDALIKNLVISGADITVTNNNISVSAGILAGESLGTVKNVIVSGSISTNLILTEINNVYIGGLIGITKSGSGKIFECETDVTLTSDITSSESVNEYIGGLIGNRHSNTTVEFCEAKSAIILTGEAPDAGSSIGTLTGNSNMSYVSNSSGIFKSPVSGR